jgi:predicted dinucleotide-binding enzyme
MKEGAPLFQKIALIGVGLIGSSIARAVRRAELGSHIAGYAPRAETRERAEAAGFADYLTKPLDRELLVPLVRDAIRAIDVDGGRIDVDARFLGIDEDRGH